MLKALLGLLAILGIIYAVFLAWFIVRLSIAVVQSKLEKRGGKANVN